MTCAERIDAMATLRRENERLRALLEGQQRLASLYADGWAAESVERANFEQENAELRRRLAAKEDA